MSLREKLNQNPQITTIAALVIVLAAIAALWYAISGPAKLYYGSTAYYTSDDGATYYSDRADLVVPFTDNGKEVVRAHVYQCPSKGKFVAFLQRYTPQAAEALKESQEAKAAGREPKNPGLVAMIDQIGSEYKKPGDGNKWIKSGSADPIVGDIMKLCDNKPGEIAQIVIP